MTDTEATLTVTRNDAAHRYEIHSDGALAGYTQIRVGAGGHVLLPHTEIDPAFAGQGLGKVLAREALSDIARRGEIAVPTCPFISRYLRENEVPGLIIEWPHRLDAQDAATPGEQPA